MMVKRPCRSARGAGCGKVSQLGVLDPLDNGGDVFTPVVFRSDRSAELIHGWIRKREKDWGISAMARIIGADSKATAIST